MEVFQRLLRRLSDAITHFHIILDQNVCLATLQKNCFWKEASISISLHLWFISNVFAMSISRHQCWRILVPVVCVSHKSFLDNIIFPILILKLNIFEDIQHILSICLSRASYYTIDTFLIFFLKENCFECDVVQGWICLLSIQLCWHSFGAQILQCVVRTVVSCIITRLCSLSV